MEEIQHVYTHRALKFTMMWMLVGWLVGWLDRLTKALNDYDTEQIHRSQETQSKPVSCCNMLVAKLEWFFWTLSLAHFQFHAQFFSTSFTTIILAFYHSLLCVFIVYVPLTAQSVYAHEEYSYRIFKMTTLEINMHIRNMYSSCILYDKIVKIHEKPN